MPDRVVWRDTPEFLPISDGSWVRVACVNDVEQTADGEMHMWAHGDWIEVVHPYAAAWLDRLGIPWTEELRKAHAAAGKGEA